MTKRVWTRITVALLLSASLLLYGYWRWGSPKIVSRDELLASMPTDPDAIIFVDLAALRQAPFFTQLLAWAPRPQADAEYLQFLKDTGFDYERDLDRMALAVQNQTPQHAFFLVAGGRFNRQEIVAYAQKTGGVETRQGREAYFVPGGGTSRGFHFTFLRNNVMALSDAPESIDSLNTKKDDAGWRARFDRLSGSPIFAVIRGTPANSATLSQQAPHGFSSPQLSSLLAQMPWISVAAKPDGDSLLVIAEGECLTDAAARQLADFLNGIIMLAEAGLTGPQPRSQLNPAARSAYLDLLKNADVSRIDRGDTKAVRLTFYVTPQLLQAAH